MFLFKDIRQYHNDLNNTKTSCVEVVENYLQQIEANKKLNAFTEVFKEDALKKAAEVDEVRKQG